MLQRISKKKKGKVSWIYGFLYGGCGVEYFPLGKDNLRLHAVFFRDNHDRINNYDIGLTWKFDIYKRN